MQKQFDGYLEGPLGPQAGFKCTVAWNDQGEFHRFYAVGFETAEQAKLAALNGAKDLGYVEPKRWQFWRQRIFFK